MAEYKREDASKLLSALKKGKVLPVYLLIGDRYLCKAFADKLIKQLISDPNQLKHNLFNIDGEREAPIETLNLLKTFSLFPGQRVIKVVDSQLFQAKVAAKSLWNQAQKAGLGKKNPQAGRFLRQFISTGSIKFENGQELCRLSVDKWKTNFGFTKPKDSLNWVEEAFDYISSGGKTKGVDEEKDNASLYMEALSSGIPDGNTLVLLAEEVDKRKKFYKFIKEKGAVLDMSVTAGLSSAAQKDQEKVLRTLVKSTLEDFGKTIEPRALNSLLDRVGFHPVAVVCEAEKLALFVGDNSLISGEDVEEIIGRTKEDAIFELTEAFSQKNLFKCLLVTTRMIESGTHPLVLVSGLRNHLRKQLLICSLRRQPYPVYVEGMTYAAFQKGYLPQLKEEKSDLLKKLPNHPYALYMMFEKVKNQSVADLMKGQKKLLEAEMRLKSSTLSESVVFENFLFEMLV